MIYEEKHHTLNMDLDPDGVIAMFQAESSELSSACADILARSSRFNPVLQETTQDLMEVASALLDLGSDLAHLTHGAYENKEPDLEGCAGCLEDLTSQSTEAVRNLIGVAAQLLQRAT